MNAFLIAFSNGDGTVTLVSPTNPLPVTGGGGGGGGNVNLTQVGGTNVTTGTGNATAGTQRVVLASDQPPLSNTDGLGFQRYHAIASGTGYSAEDILAHLVSGKFGTTTYREQWINISTGTVIDPPSLADIMAIDMATLFSLGFPSDAPWTGTGDMSLAAGVKAMAVKMLDNAPAEVFDSSCLTFTSGAVDEAKGLVSGAPAVVLGAWFKNNSADTEVFFRLFDAATTGGANLATEAKLTFGLKGGRAATIDIPSALFPTGVVIACTAGRANATAPSADGEANVYYRAV